MQIWKSLVAVPRNQKQKEEAKVSFFEGKL